jgi:hypothetical protein
VANWSHGEGNRYVVKTVLNQHGKASDLNEGAFGSYVYLLQTRDKEDSVVVASMIGEGSVLVLITFVAVSICIIETIYIVKKKRQYKAGLDTDKQVDSEE